MSFSPLSPRGDKNVSKYGSQSPLSSTATAPSVSQSRIDPRLFDSWNNSFTNMQKSSGTENSSIVNQHPARTAETIPGTASQPSKKQNLQETPKNHPLRHRLHRRIQKLLRQGEEDGGHELPVQLLLDAYMEEAGITKIQEELQDEMKSVDLVEYRTLRMTRRSAADIATHGPALRELDRIYGKSGKKGKKARKEAKLMARSTQSAVTSETPFTLDPTTPATNAPESSSKMMQGSVSDALKVGPEPTTPLKRKYTPTQISRPKKKPGLASAFDIGSPASQDDFPTRPLPPGTYGEGFFDEPSYKPFSSYGHPQAFQPSAEATRNSLLRSYRQPANLQSLPGFKVQKAQHPNSMPGTSQEQKVYYNQNEQQSSVKTHGHGQGTQSQHPTSTKHSNERVLNPAHFSNGGQAQQLERSSLDQSARNHRLLVEIRGLRAVAMTIEKELDEKEMTIKELKGDLVDKDLAMQKLNGEWQATMALYLEGREKQTAEIARLREVLGANVLQDSLGASFDDAGIPIVGNGA